MRAIVIDSPGHFELREVPDPVAKSGEVVITVDGCGVCGTDLHILDGHVPFTRYPIIPGHEFSGRIESVGAGVDPARIGQLVAVEPSLFCGSCRPCRHGRENLCERFDAIGVGSQPGGCAEAVAVPADKAFLIPNGVDPRLGPLVEPTACAVHGIDMLAPVLGDEVLVYGAGTMGLILCQLLVRMGLRVSMLDHNRDRLPLATRLGASAVGTDADAFSSRFACVIDATGAIGAIEDALTRVERGGTLLLFGVAPDDQMVRISPFRVYNEEIRIIGSMAICHSYERALALCAAGVIDADAMITHRFPLADYAQAIETFRAGSGLKLVVEPGR